MYPLKIIIPDTTKKPKTKKKHLWTELLVSGKSFDSFPGVFLVSLGFLEREFVFFGFRRVASSRNQKNSRKMLALEVSKLQKPKKTIFFCFSASKTKKPNTLSRKPKETKKTPGKPKNQNFSLKPRILFQKIVFWVFGFLVVACLKSPNSKKPKTLEENVGLGSQQAPETNKTYRKNSFLWYLCAV